MPVSSIIKPLLRGSLSLVPLSVYQRLIPRDVIGLNYHMVSDTWPGHVAHVCPFKSTAQFEADLVYLKESCRVLDYEQAKARRARHYSDRVKPEFIITFDDGFRECLTNVIPLLKKHGLPAVFFVTTDFIDNKSMFYRNIVSLCVDTLDHLPADALETALGQLQLAAGRDLESRKSAREWLLKLSINHSREIEAACDVLGVDPEAFLRERKPYLTSDEIIAIDSDQFRIGAHSQSHCRVNQDGDLTRAERELAGSCRIVADLVGRKSVPFAFPFTGSYLEPPLLGEVLSRNPVVDSVFDSRGILKNADYVTHRIGADSPEGAVPRGGNLPRLIHAAYASQLPLELKKAIESRSS